MTSVLVIEDEAIFLRNIARYLRGQGFEVLTATTCALAMRNFLERDVDVLCLDVNLPDGNGLELLAEIRKTKPNLPTIVITASASEATRNRATELGVLAYFTKPFALEDLARTIVQILAAVKHKNA